MRTRARARLETDRHDDVDTTSRHGNPRDDRLESFGNTLFRNVARIHCGTVRRQGPDPFECPTTRPMGQCHLRSRHGESDYVSY